MSTAKGWSLRSATNIRLGFSTRLWPELSSGTSSKLRLSYYFGGIGAAIGLFVPVPVSIVVLVVAVVILLVQIYASYDFLRRVFRWLALALLAYAGSAVLAQPDLKEVLVGTFVPRVQFTTEFLSMVVA